jgi:hypothetical protein
MKVFQALDEASRPPKMFLKYDDESLYFFVPWGWGHSILLEMNQLTQLTS